MNRQDRAKQFMPFAALRGYYDKILEKQKVLEEKKELSDSTLQLLSDRLTKLKKAQMLSVTYYNKDHYDTIEGLVSNIDTVFKTLRVVKTTINFDDIYDLSFLEE